MENKKISINELNEFLNWKRKLIYIINNFEKLIENSKTIKSGDLLEIDSLKNNILQQKIKISFIGEFSRGKSELINSILFTKDSGMILKSSIGQTTMCPLEINNNDGNGNYLELLPIETKRSDVLLKTLKLKKGFWYKHEVFLNGNTDKNQSMEILYDKSCVSIEDARKMGLCKPFNSLSRDQQKTVCQSCGLGKVLIPRWRYGKLYINHDILNYGVTIIDTPGLNSLGAEPELTLDILNDIDLIVFVLGVDTGVTQSDLELWENHVLPLKNKHKIIAINKIDTILESSDIVSKLEIKKEIEKQIEITASTLGVSPSNVVAVSGKLGVLSKKNFNKKTIEDSNIEEFEKKIYEQIFSIKKNKIINSIMVKLLPIIEKEKDHLKEMLKQNELISDKLLKVKNNSLELIPSRIEHHKLKINKFSNDQDYLKSKLRALRKDSDTLIIKPLDIDKIEEIIDLSKRELLEAWTTSTMIRRFNLFFERALNIFDSSLDGSERFSKILEKEYKEMMIIYQLKNINKSNYNIMPKRTELLELINYYERFGSKLEIAANTQNKVVKNTFLTVASKIRDFVESTKNEVQIALDDLFLSIDNKIDESKKYIKEELKSLEGIQKMSSTIDKKIEENIKEKEYIINLEKNLNDMINDLMEVFAE